MKAVHAFIGSLVLGVQNVHSMPICKNKSPRLQFSRAAGGSRVSLDTLYNA